LTKKRTWIVAGNRDLGDETGCRDEEGLRYRLQITWKLVNIPEYRPDFIYIPGLKDMKTCICIISLAFGLPGVWKGSFTQKNGREVLRAHPLNTSRDPGCSLSR